MRVKIVSMVMLVLFAATLVACGGETNVSTPTPSPAPVPTPASGNTSSTGSAGQASHAGQPDHITVQHILIGFKDAVGFQGSPPPKAAGRTQEQAKTLAYSLLSQAKAGADYDKLVADNTDDSPPGIYSMANSGIQPDKSKQEYSRDGMVPAFGNVGFTLQVGEIGIADYDPQTSPYGYHIIKRIK